MKNFSNLLNTLLFVWPRLFAGTPWLPNQTVRLKRLCMMP